MFGVSDRSGLSQTGPVGFQFRVRPEGPWRGKKDVELATLDWVHWYNDKRLYGPLGYISPATAERNFYNAELTANIAAE